MPKPKSPKAAENPPASPPARAADCLRLRGVRQNNLQGFDLDLPLGRLIVVTGLSGSGKSSLAFQTLYAEGQRRYIETFSPYARQFFDRMDKPAVDRIENIPPAIAIEQRNAVRTSRSTVGTMTEVCDHLKVLWTRLSRLHCRQCGRVVRTEPPQVVWMELAGARGAVGRADGGEDDAGGLRDFAPRYRPFAAAASGRVPPPFPAAGAGEVGGPGEPPPPAGAGLPEVLVTFDLPLSDRLTVAEQLRLLGQQGFQRLLLGGRVVRWEEAEAEAGRERSLVVVVDRVRLAPANRARFIEAAEQAYQFGRGRLALRPVPGTGPGAEDPPRRFSRGFHCAACDLEYREPTPALFSFNHPIGACPACKGFGRIIAIDPQLALPDPSKTLAAGAVKPWQSGMSAECQNDLVRAARRSGVPLDVPFRELSAEHQRWVMEGDAGYDPEDPEQAWPKRWYGVKGYFRWLEGKAYKMHVRVLLSRYRSYRVCPTCRGQRFQPESLLFRLPVPAGFAGAAGRETLTLADFYQLPLRDSLALVEALDNRVPADRHDPLRLVLEEVRTRIGFLVDVGLGYLTLDRTSRTLSGGETERVNLTTCLGTRLVNTLYVLDEPSVGLHPRDTDRLVRILQRLRDLGNTVVVVEHEAAVMRAADHLVDLGPGHGESGGRVVYQGPVTGLERVTGSLTADYLSGRRTVPVPPRRPVTANLPRLCLTGASAHNLRDVSVEIPLGRLVAITGVSGSGKTTLVRDILLPRLLARLGDSPAAGDAGEEEEEDQADREGGPIAGVLTGAEALGAAVLVDQSALGRTPRSNPAVYIGAFEDIRDVFASTEAARARGLNSSAFSFNSAVGQCERCRGAGFEKIEMQFLSDVFIRCPECQGRRYRPHILEVKATSGGRSWSIADLLEAPVEEALRFLEGWPDSKAARRAVGKLRLLGDVGLGYLRVGQPINTLSGGESQRLKLVSHLAGSAAESLRVDPVPPTLAARLGPDALAVLQRSRRPTLFVFDEPTTGLHFEDVRVLLAVFQRLVGAGHSVLVIEHNLDVIKSADWVMDLGPEAGDQGGRVVAAGTPEEVARVEASHTGRFLRELLRRGPAS